MGFFICYICIIVFFFKEYMENGIEKFVCFFLIEEVNEVVV